jgi:hypothetical protein
VLITLVTKQRTMKRSSLYLKLNAKKRKKRRERRKHEVKKKKAQTIGDDETGLRTGNVVVEKGHGTADIIILRTEGDVVVPKTESNATVPKTESNATVPKTKTNATVLRTEDAEIALKIENEGIIVKENEKDLKTVIGTIDTGTRTNHQNINRRKMIQN